MQEFCQVDWMSNCEIVDHEQLCKSSKSLGNGKISDMLGYEVNLSINRKFITNISGEINMWFKINYKV